MHQTLATLGLLSCTGGTSHLCFYYLAVLRAVCSSINLYKYTIFITNKSFPVSRWLTSYHQRQLIALHELTAETKLKSKKTNQEECHRKINTYHIQHILSQDNRSSQGKSGEVSLLCQGRSVDGSSLLCMQLMWAPL